MSIRAAILALCLTCAATSVQAGELSGTLRDASALPVAGATVTLPELGRATTTDANGRYSFDGLAAGRYAIAVSVADDIRQHSSAAVPAEGEATRNLFLLSNRALDHARDGINPAQALLADVLMARAWEAAQAMDAEREGEPQVSWIADDSEG